jgi:hypothetical protein
MAMSGYMSLAMRMTARYTLEAQKRLNGDFGGTSTCLAEESIIRGIFNRLGINTDKKSFLLRLFFVATSKA